jgi:hypothetical protein
MKKIILLMTLVFSLSLVFAQSPCCKNKAKGVSCKNSAQVADASKIVDGNETLPACCKGKAKQGLSCCQNKVQNSDSPSCSSKQWWQVWKKGCDKPCCKK